jgi:hypothetical protein
MDEDAGLSDESGRQFDILSQVLDAEENEFRAYEQELEQGAAEQIAELQRGLSSFD